MHFALVNRIMNDPTIYEIVTADALEERAVHAMVS